MAIKKVFGIELSKVNYQNTYNGVAYTSQIKMDGEEIGQIRNDGNGGTTNIRIIGIEKRQEFINRMQRYFNNVIGLKTEGVSLHSQEYTFAEHLLDFKEYGHLSETRKLRFLN